MTKSKIKREILESLNEKTGIPDCVIKDLGEYELKLLLGQMSSEGLIDLPGGIIKFDNEGKTKFKITIKGMEYLESLKNI